MYRSKTLMLLENSDFRILFLLREYYCMLSPRNWKWEIPVSQKFQKKKGWCSTFLLDIDFVDENIHIYANIHCLSLNLLCKSRQVQNPIYILDEKFCEVVSGAWEEWLGNNCQKWSICFSKRSLFLEETPLCLDFNQTFQKFLPHSRCEWKAG